MDLSTNNGNGSNGSMDTTETPSKTGSEPGTPSGTANGMATFARCESEVRGYCRAFPVVFATGKGSQLIDEEGNDYIDFFSGAGTLNYGHNNPVIKEAVQTYIDSDGVIHGLDMATEAKRDFLETFESLILRPRKLDYKIQFPGPTGTNAVEAAMKLARKVKGRTNIVSFTNGFHGMTLGSVAATGNSFYREGAGQPLNNTSFMPYCDYLGDSVDSLRFLRKFLEDGSSGLDHPAAVIVETVQGEGGLNVASAKWLRGLQRLCKRFDILLIVDDIQVGNGRTGTFFSFEEAGIVPDIVLLSKSLSAYGLPMSVVLMKPELDQWQPGEHNGTFRGNNLAFVAATAALKQYWSDDSFVEDVQRKSDLIQRKLEEVVQRFDAGGISHKGRGMIQGLEFEEADLASEVSKACFEKKLILETSGCDGQVGKCLPPLVIEDDLLERGLDILETAVADVLAARQNQTDESHEEASALAEATK